MTGDLRVDTAALASEARGLLSAAGDIPTLSGPFTAVGGDALSTVLNARTQALEAPLMAGLPVTKAEALRTAQNILKAAGIYERVDQQLADEILQTLLGAPGGADGGGEAAAADAGGTGATAAAPIPAAAGGAPAAGAAEQSGQLGQLMGMPMQMAAQAAQIPMQLAAMAGAIPQALMQGMQSAMQQVGETSGLGDEAGRDDHAQLAHESADDAETPKDKHVDEVDGDVGAAEDPSGAAGESSGVGAVPEAGSAPDPAPETPPAHRPAPTRPATSGPESVL